MSASRRLRVSCNAWALSCVTRQEITDIKVTDIVRWVLRIVGDGAGRAMAVRIRGPIRHAAANIAKSKALYELDIESSFIRRQARA